MPIELIISDVDGCMTSEGSVPFDLPAFHRLADLCRAASEGRGGVPPITLCTGRPQPYVEVLMKVFDIRIPAICENGAVVYTLTDNHARYGPGVTQEKVLALREVRAFIERDLLPRHPGAIMQFGKEAQLSVFCERPEVLPPLVEPIRRFGAEDAGVVLDVTASHFYLNISLDGVNKGAAIEWLLGELNIDRAHAAGIGDTVGDMPIRHAVDFFACPSNAHGPIREVADYVASKPEIEGTLEILTLLQESSEQ